MALIQSMNKLKAAAVAATDALSSQAQVTLSAAAATRQLAVAAQDAGEKVRVAFVGGVDASDEAVGRALKEEGNAQTATNLTAEVNDLKARLASAQQRSGGLSQSAASDRYKAAQDAFTGAYQRTRQKDPVLEQAVQDARKVYEAAARANQLQAQIEEAEAKVAQFKEDIRVITIQGAQAQAGAYAAGVNAQGGIRTPEMAASGGLDAMVRAANEAQKAMAALGATDISAVVTQASALAGHLSAAATALGPPEPAP